MQAGESLSFITMPHELATPERPSDQDAELVALAYIHAVNRLMDRYPEVFQNVESDDLTVIEGSFQVLHSDGSYVHIALFSIKDSEGLLSVGVSLVEHSDEGKYLGGYLFELTGEEVTCSRHGSSDEIGGDEDDETLHFSVLDMFKNKEELYQAMLHEDEDLRQDAEANWGKLNDAAKLAAYEKELGFGIAYPSIEDINKLQQLMDMAGPFVPSDAV
jgi:hypothetical protein